ncbi:break repair meiotic recombinase recruitment factor 1 isoform X2 [Rhinoderma darwinii]|uniref:break repair meiotic recombinase recruitment factor 1 isoform X2 n=2 Tax=Rhinoderma darwinii TaxID=43563 RepID=UPI003F66AB15
MKRKRKVTNANSTSRNTSEGSVISPEPTFSQPSLKNQEPSENCVEEEDDSAVDHNRKLEAPQQNICQTDDHQPCPCPGFTEGQLNATNPEVFSPLPLTAVLQACHQGDYLDTDARDSIVPPETSTAIITEPSVTEQVSDGITGNLCLTAIETAESNISEKCLNETDVPDTSITEAINFSGQVDEGARDYQTSDTPKCPIMFVEGSMKGDVNGDDCKPGDTSEMLLIDTCMDKNVSARPGDSSPLKEPKSDLLASQKCLIETSELPFLPSEASHLQDTPNIPEITYQIKDTFLPDCDLKLEGRDVEHCQDPKSQPKVIMSPEDTWAMVTDQTLLCGVEMIRSQQTDALPENPRGLTNDLGLQDSQLLGALEESFYEQGKGVENHISDQMTSASHRQETPQATTSPPSLSVNAAPAQDIRGPQQRTEDASSTVQGLIMELSNLKIDSGGSC